jgi:hypothetical protein
VAWSCTFDIHTCLSEIFNAVTPQLSPSMQSQPADIFYCEILNLNAKY